MRACRARFARLRSKMRVARRSARAARRRCAPHTGASTRRAAGGGSRPLVRRAVAPDDRRCRGRSWPEQPRDRGSSEARWSVPKARNKDRTRPLGNVRGVTGPTWCRPAPIRQHGLHRLVVSRRAPRTARRDRHHSHPSGDPPVMRTSHPAVRLLTFAFALITVLAGCETKRERARADSLQAITDRQLALTTSLSSQKDSLMRAIFESDSLLTKIDSQIRTVKGLPAKKRVKRNYESPLEEQLVRRKELTDRVEALVQRARVTATELADSRKREQELRGKNDTLQLRIEDDQRIIAELGNKVQQQAETIAALELRVDSLVTETRVMGERYYRAYYVVGTEDELLERGIVEREGGANLLFARIGRTLQPARALDPELFTAIDRRDIREIPLPDSTKRYAVVSRQSLDNAEVAERDEEEFKGLLRIPDPERFWGTSRFLILVAK